MIPLPYVHTYTDRTGKTRRYFRRKGRSIALPGIPGSREFMDAYAACLADQKIAVADPLAPSPGSVAAVILRYYTSSQYRNLAPITKDAYRRTLDRFVAEHGARNARQMTSRHVEAIIARLGDKDGAAHYLLKRLRTVMRFAVKERLIPSDPTTGVALSKIGEIHTWTDAELAVYEERWPIGTKQRLAYSLLLYTGQRNSDACRLTWPGPDGFRVTQQKTGVKLVIPVHPGLGLVLAGTARQHMVVMVTDYGKPFSVKGFGNMVNEAIRKAGLPERCVAHGLRKAAARRLAEAGATEKQIAAITGHTTLAEVERYTRAADQGKLARAAMEKQAANDHVANGVANASQKPQKSGNIGG